ncbi:hypothetical protein [uncultured Shewanella sp.]|uniref:hypothetical protein n=1 Tax=uncultured Shewanella sp. TaxID=173975 RepID=UPI00260A53C4|nr:hypothetical protein [uncultured Shewanella sp.]
MPVTLNFSSQNYKLEDHNNKEEFSNFKINDQRLAKMVFGENESEATSLKSWNKFSLRMRSIFSSSNNPLETKEKGIKELHKLISQPTKVDDPNPYDRLNALAKLTGPDHGAQFKLQLSEKDQTAELFIDGVAVRKEKVTSEQFQQMKAQIGQTEEKGNILRSVKVLDGHKKDTAKLETLSNDNFKGGGVNKKFDGSTGVLKGMNDTAMEDFALEADLLKYKGKLSTTGQGALERYISLQEQIPVKDLPTGLDSKQRAKFDAALKYDKQHGTNTAAGVMSEYAQVSMYKKGVKSKELDVCLPNPVLSASSDPKIRAKGLPSPSNMLSTPEKKAVATQMVDMLRVMYNNKVSHRDLHSHNLLVHRFKDENGEPVTMLKAIDFGRAKYGEKDFEAHKFEDIRYIFNREGASKAETAARNQLLPKMVDSRMVPESQKLKAQEKLAKHYPMHNLIPTQGGIGRNTEIFLANIGDTLVSDLIAAGSDQQKIDAAFFAASQAVENAFSDTRSINVTSLV